MSADNAVQAREKAFEKAQIDGYTSLLEEMGLDGDIPDPKQISSYVKNFEVTKEQLSATRYKGVYTITYDTDHLVHSNDGYRMADDQGGYPSYSDVRRLDKTLLLPYYQINNQTFLWNNNPFLEAFVSAKADGMLQGITIPLATSMDQQQVPGYQPLSIDEQSLRPIAMRYGANKTMILIAQPRVFASGHKDMIVRIYEPKLYERPALVAQVPLQSMAGESQDMFYRRVIGQVVDIVSDQTKPLNDNQPKTANYQSPPPVFQNNVVTFDSQSTDPQYADSESASSLPSQPYRDVRPTGPQYTIKAQLNFQSMRQWVDMKKKMQQSPVIGGLAIKTLSPRFALLDISYYGTQQDLQNALQQAGIMFIDPVTFSQANHGGAGRIYQLRALDTGRRF